jgi:hypothetical protein
LFFGERFQGVGDISWRLQYFWIGRDLSGSGSGSGPGSIEIVSSPSPLKYGIKVVTKPSMAPCSGNRGREVRQWRTSKGCRIKVTYKDTLS